MKTPKFSKVYYDPYKQSIVFLRDDKPVYGFTGEVAFKKLIDACADPHVSICLKDAYTEERVRLIIQFHTILYKKGLIDLKKDIIQQYNVSSTKKLTNNQLKEIVANLNQIETREEIRKGRSTVLSLLDQLNVKGNNRIGWKQVNSFLQHPRIAGKTLYEMNVQELKECSLKLRCIINKNKTRSL